MMKLTEPRVNHLDRPLGYQLSPLSFGWKVTGTAPGAKQAWARLRVFCGTETLYDSGEDPRADSLDTPLSLPLQPRTAYRWSVEVCATSGERARAESSFETGKTGEPWQARWITAVLDAGTHTFMEE